MVVLAVGDKAEAPSFYSSLTDISYPSDVISVPTTSDSVHQHEAQISEQSPMVLEPETERAAETDDSETQWATFITLLEDRHRQFGNISSGLKTMLTRLTRVTTVGHWEAFMHNAGSGMPLRHHPRAAIRVQPTSVS